MLSIVGSHGTLSCSVNRQIRIAFDQVDHARVGDVAFVTLPVEAQTVGHGETIC